VVVEEEGGGGGADRRQRPQAMVSIEGFDSNIHPW